MKRRKLNRANRMTLLTLNHILLQLQVIRDQVYTTSDYPGVSKYGHLGFQYENSFILRVGIFGLKDIRLLLLARQGATYVDLALIMYCVVALIRETE